MRQSPDQHLVLLGFMGVGKTTLGSQLSLECGLPFYDLDTWIEQRNGIQISDMLPEALAYFRALETEHLIEILALPKGIISLGGGTFLSSRNREILKNHYTAFLASEDKEIEEIWKSQTRPLLLGMSSAQDAIQLYLSRLPDYQLADQIFSGRAQETKYQLLNWIHETKHTI